MKISFLMTGLLGLITVTAFAQKGELTTAQTEYTKYESLKGNKAMGTLALNSLKTARVSIDKAAANDKTAALPLTYALKGSIYASMALNDTSATTSTPLFTTAEEAVKKGKELDTKGENKALLTSAELTLAQYQLNKGVKEYGDKKYDLAYKSFDYYRSVLPEDTNAIYYTGLAAANAGNWDAALTNYGKLLTTNYSKKISVYQDMSGFYLQKKDTTNAIKIMTDASAKYPNDAYLAKRVLEMNLQTGKQAEVLSKIESTIATDPKNKTLYYYAGITYTQVADQANKKIAKNKDVAAVAALTKTRDENFAKAEDMYRKALVIDPNYFEANLNLGYVMINPAIDLFNAARNYPVSKQKEYDAAMAKANGMFDAAKPYLLKAVELQPKNVDALTNLRTYYLGKKDMTNANLIKKQIDDIQAGGAAAPAKQ
jgi:tetratricopeptide (TPR) repeat protein